jgi:hypothetical protein
VRKQGPSISVIDALQQEVKKFSVSPIFSVAEADKVIWFSQHD